MKLRLSFVRGRGWSSGVIALKTGLYSHVDIELPDGRLLGARWDKADGVAGVAIRRPGYETWARRMVVEIEISDEQWDLGWRWLQKQLGRPYDWKAIAAFVFERDWREEAAWFCSELVIRFLEVIGFIKELYLPYNKVDPGLCGAVVQVTGEVVSHV